MVERTAKKTENFNKIIRKSNLNKEQLIIS